MPIGPVLAAPAADNDFHNAYVTRVAASFARVTGQSLVDLAGLDPTRMGPSAWAGPFALLTHRGDAEATLNYANAFALGLWELDWEQLIVLPSAATAPLQAIGHRDAMMEKVIRDNFVSGYSGRRISRSGRLFQIENVTIWRLLEESGESFGVGAFFRQTRPLTDEKSL